MGTSTSSRGPGSGPDIAIVPPWVASPVQPDDKPPEEPAIAQPARWRGVRTALGKFGGGGEARGKHLRRGLGHYSKTGMGGSGNAAKRMSGSANAAGALYETLTSLAQGLPPPGDVNITFQGLAGLPPREVADAIVDAIRPIDGTQDAEATRDSVARALSEILAQDADLTNLTSEQIEHVVASALGNDVALRIELDVGKSIIDKAPTKGEGLERLQELKDYVREVVAKEYSLKREQFGQLSRASVEQISNDAIRQTFEVFEIEGGLK